MIQIFFTIIFIAELIIFFKLISIIENLNKQVLAVTKQVNIEKIQLKKDLTKIRNMMLNGCIKTTETVCNLSKFPQRFSKSMLKTILKKFLYSLLHINLQKIISVAGVFFTIKKFLKSS